MNKQQQEQLGFMVMWVKDWQVGFELSVTKANGQDLELTRHQRHQIESLKWYAFMAESECKDLGLDPAIVLTDTMLQHANEYQAAQ